MRAQRKYLAALILLALMSQAACDTSVHKIKVKLNEAAKILHAAAQSSHDLYEAGVYGPKGTAPAIEMRQNVATAIGKANDALIQALNVAKTLKADSVEPGKTELLKILAQAIAALSTIHTGNQKVDVAIQASAALINNAIVLITALKG